MEWFVQNFTKVKEVTYCKHISKVPPLSRGMVAALANVGGMRNIR